MSPPRAPSADELAELTRLHREVRYLDAFHYAQQFAPPEQWTDTEALLLAGRLFSCWGDWGRSNRLHSASYRRAPADPKAIYFYALTVEHKHGPFEALRFLREKRAVVETTTPELYHVWLWLNEARLLGIFRDFEAAEALIARAAPHAGDDPWLWVERAQAIGAARGEPLAHAAVGGGQPASGMLERVEGVSVAVELGEEVGERLREVRGLELG